MTFSILARDPVSGAIGGAAATGSLCVGGWVLRGRLGAGMSASQGASPSTFWGEDVLTLMETGSSAERAVHQVVQADQGREHRQLSALDMSGAGASFDGNRNTPTILSTCFPNGVAGGNMLKNSDGVDSMVTTFNGSDTPFADRLLNALIAADAAGSDSRGLLSAALFVLHPEQAPLTLRIDYHPDDPIGALRFLYGKATSGEYAKWAAQVPTITNEERVLDDLG